MKTKTNRTLRKILSIALCLALVMSYVPMVSITAGAVESTIPVIEGYGFDSDDSEFGAVFINPITSYTSAAGTSWSDEAGKGNLIFQWGYGDTLDVTLVDPDGVVSYETSNIQAHSDYSKSSDLHWAEFPLSSDYEDGTYITATHGFDNYINDGFIAEGFGSVANVFTQTASGDPSFLSDDMLMYGESIIENGTTSMSFDHIPATFRFIITNTHEKALSLESVTLRVVDADGNSVPAAAKFCDIEIKAENRYPELFYSNSAYSTYDSITTNLLNDYTLEPGKSYIAYALALPLANMDTWKCDDAAFEGKTIQVGVTTSEGECIAFELAGDDIANANPGNTYNWVGGKSYTMRMGTRCYDGCAFDITGKCTVCGYECTHKFDDNGFCLTCDVYQPAVLNADGYYEIGNVGNLFWLAEQVNYGSLTKFNAVLTSDLIIPDSKQWMPINLLDGIQNASVFDGNGHSITLNQSSGLFSSFNYSVFRNVILYGTVTANTTGNIGAVVGSAYRTTIQNVISYVDVTNSNGNAGGLAGYFGGKHSDEMYSKIENCAVYADISGTNAGGLIGEGWNGTQYFDIANCTYVGDITGTNAGAIVGYQNTDSNTCVFTNIYWCEADGIGFYGKRDTSNQVYTNTMAKTPEQFASGEVAYLLQQGNTVQIWGQMSNTEGSLPIITDNELYKVVTVGETGNYSVANVGDTNGDGTVDVTDYQALVNKALADDHEQIETASYDDIVKYDLDGDGYLDVIDAYLLHLFINGFTTVDVYAVGDYDLNGIAFEEADIKAIKHAIENPEKLATYKKYASDINGDGKLDENDLTVLVAKYGEVTGTECADNVKVYYRWGNKYSTCTATAMCTLCGEKVATETVNTTSETLAELTCIQDGRVKYTATFQNELLGTKTIEIVSKTEGHKYIDGVCAVCGLTMTAEELKAVVAQQLAAGETDIEVALAPDAPAEMITAIRRAICDTEGVADGSIHLTLKGVTTIPGTTNWDGVAFGPGDIYDEAGKIVDQELVTQLASINLPDVTEIGAQAF
ncbi:MAG: dockerin type I repeat-containing protein, partial [Clostridia bacterium]|nr:dockerin type I repeat-containing protein [Clostridia bacterium]